MFRMILFTALILPGAGVTLAQGQTLRLPGRITDALLPAADKTQLQAICGNACAIGEEAEVTLVVRKAAPQQSGLNQRTYRLFQDDGNRLDLRLGARVYSTEFGTIRRSSGFPPTIGGGGVGTALVRNDFKEGPAFAGELPLRDELLIDSNLFAVGEPSAVLRLLCVFSTKEGDTSAFSTVEFPDPFPRFTAFERALCSATLGCIGCSYFRVVIDWKLQPSPSSLPLTTKDITVLGWIDGSRIDIEPLRTRANKMLINVLEYPAACVIAVTEWAVGRKSGIFSEADRRFANAYLVKNSPNSEPPSVIDADRVLADGDFRMFNRFRITLTNQTNDTAYSPVQSTAVVGTTPDPCGVLPFNTAGETHETNGLHGVVSDGSKIFQLNQGRLGELAQRVNATLNGTSTPWTWNVISFKRDGDYSFDHQLFPTIFVYENGRLVYRKPQADIEVFNALGAEKSLKTVATIN